MKEPMKGGMLRDIQCKYQQENESDVLKRTYVHEKIFSAGFFHDGVLPTHVTQDVSCTHCRYMVSRSCYKQVP